MNQSQAEHRLFFALKPPADTLGGLLRVQRQLKCKGGRAIPQERLHATLLFLGNTSRRDLERLKDIAAGVRFSPFRLLLDHLGHFPRAEVAWLGARRIPRELSDLFSGLRQAVSTEGIGFDAKKFRLHVTLYRNLRTRPGIIHFEPVEWYVDDFLLMESVHTRDGLEYQCRGRWRAAKGDI